MAAGVCRGICLSTFDKKGRSPTMKRTSLLAAIALALFASGPVAAGLEPTEANVKYDTRHERNVLDFWKAESDKPTAVFVWFHGGGFKGGDKGSVGRGGLLKEFLRQGISVASCNYPFLKDASYEQIMHHCARAIQFIRAKFKQWNIDPRRVGACGPSAGALISEWIGYHSDLRNPRSSNPVERITTQLLVVGSHLQPMGTEGLVMRHMRKGGPALFIYTSAPNGDKVHDPKYAKMIKARADKLGIPAQLVGGGKNDIPPPPEGETWLSLQVKFFCKHYRVPYKPLESK